MPANSAKPSVASAEADLAFMRSIVEGGGRPHLTLGVAYLAGGLLYGVQCLFHVGQAMGLIRWPGPVTLAFLVLVTVSFCVVLGWAVYRDRKDGVGTMHGPMATRILNAAFSASGMANLAVILVFGFGAMRDRDFAIWLYYPAVIFALQAAAWYVAWSLKRKHWMLACSVGGWLTAVALGLLVRQPLWFLGVCTVAMFALFALPGWIMVREARAARKAG